MLSTGGSEVNTREILLSFKREDGIFPCASGLRFADAHPDPHEAIDAALAVPLNGETCDPLEWHNLRFTAWVVNGRPDADLPYCGLDLEKARALTEKAAEFLREYLRGMR